MRNLKHITALKAQKNQQRVNVYLDGEFVFGLDLDDIYKHRLKIGLQLTHEQIDQILKDSEYHSVLEKVIRFISLRPRSEKELSTWLNKHQVGTLLGDRVSQRLRELDLLNDQKFVDWWIASRSTYKPRGSKLLYQELLQKGIDRQLIDQALSQLPNQKPSISVLVRKKLPSLVKCPIQIQKTKLYNFLLRKGYSYSDIKPVIDEL